MSSPAIQFDTHKFIKHLTAHGFSEEQAEALAEEQVNLLNDNLATKEDIAKIESNLQLELSKIKLEMSNLKLEMSNIEANLKLEMSNIESNLKLEMSNLKLDMSNIESKLTLAIDATRAELLKWMIGLFIAQITMFASIIFSTVG